VENIVDFDGVTKVSSAYPYDSWVTQRYWRVNYLSICAYIILVRAVSQVVWNKGWERDGTETLLE
jgi:hypothetical protein